MAKRLYRSTTNKVIGGVCGGLGEYFEIDPVLVRVITVLLFFATGFGILAYIIAWIIIPRRPLDVEPVPADYKYPSWSRYLPGLVLIGIGIILLVREHWYWFDWGEFWPIVLVVVGLFLIFRRDKKNDEVHTINATHQQSNTQNGGQVS